MKNSFNATILIPKNKQGRRIKKVRHFLDNKNITLKPIKSVRGRGAHTELPLELLPEFLLWLTPKTRAAILAGEIAEDIIKHIEDYW